MADVPTQIDAAGLIELACDDERPPLRVPYGEGALLINNPRPGRYKVIKVSDEWDVLLWDDSYRIYSIFVSDKPHNPPRGEREWECAIEYKHSGAPGTDAMIDLLMTDSVEA